MVLPVTNIKFSDINAELARSANAQYTLDNAEGRKLASAGNTGQSKTTQTTVKLSNFLGHARRNITNTGIIFDVNLGTTIKASNYATGKTYATYYLDANGRISSQVNPASWTTTPPASMTVSGLTSGDIVEVINDGRITGRGGRGGDGHRDSGPGYNGYPGGTAIQVSYPIELTNRATIAGGGGGGGGGDGGSDIFNTYTGGGGGGGAGWVVGPAGTGPGNAQAGTLTTGGAGGNSPDAGDGGKGGNLGTAGANGTNPSLPSRGAGGAAGFSIKGYSQVTVIQTGTIIGPTSA